jgi:hypothetical protein
MAAMVAQRGKDGAVERHFLSQEALGHNMRVVHFA